MAANVIIGKAGGKRIGIDLDVLRRTHLLIWASTGGGKSWLIRRLAEQLFGRVPVIIVDREGEFSSLREKFGYVLVGPGGETPADVRSAKLVAEKLLELRASAVCDLFELKHETRAEWVKIFLEALVDAPKKLWGPAVIVIDEAHLFCPEKGQGESVAYGAVCDLVGQGRKRGFGVILATQRLAKLSKNATGEMYNQAAGPTARQADRDRAAYEMGITNRKDIEEFSESLRRLEPGNFFFQGRAVAMDRVLVQVGPVETTHAEAGSGKHSAGPPPPPERVKALLPKLADLPKAAEERARTLAECKSEIRSLKAQLRAQPQPKVQRQEIRVPDVRAMERATRELKSAYDKQLVTVHAAHKALLANGARLAQALVEMAQRAAQTFGQKLPELKPIALPMLPPSGPAAEALVLPARVAGSIPAARSSLRDNGEPSLLTRPQINILRALAEFEAIGRSPIPKTWVAARARASHRSSSFTNNLGTLRTAGSIVYAGGGTISLTDVGRQQTTQVEAPTNSDEMFESCLPLLSGPQQRILRALYEAHPQPVEKTELAGRVGASPTSSAYTNNLGALRSAGMIEYGRNSTVKCASWLFID